MSDTPPGAYEGDTPPGACEGNGAVAAQHPALLQSANISRRIASAGRGSIVVIFLRSRSTDTVRIWSKATDAVFRWRRIAYLVGKSRTIEVIGARTTVPRV